MRAYDEPGRTAGRTPATVDLTDAGGGVTVRPARSHDLNDVVALWEGCGLVPPPQGFRNELTYALLRNPTLALVAVDDGETVGAIVGGYDGRTASVSRLAVRPDARRRGIARQLVSTLQARLAALGAPTDDLVVIDATDDSRAFWLGLDFAAVEGATRYRRLPASS